MDYCFSPLLKWLKNFNTTEHIYFDMQRHDILFKLPNVCNYGKFIILSNFKDKLSSFLLLNQYFTLSPEFRQGECDGAVETTRFALESTFPKKFIFLGSGTFSYDENKSILGRLPFKNFKTKPFYLTSQKGAAGLRSTEAIASLPYT